MVETSEKPMSLAEQKAVYQLARTRNQLIPTLIEQEALVPARIAPRTIIYAVGQAMVRGAHWENKGGLQAFDVAAASGRVMTYSDHNSDADHTAFAAALKRTPYSHWVDRFDYLGGLKMLERPQTNFFSHSEDVIYIATPQDLRNATRALAETPETKQRHGVLTEYLQNLQALNETARSTVHNRLDSGRIVRFYPQGGRSREPDSKIGRVDPKVGFNFLQRNTTYLPILASGAEAAFPTNGSPRPRRFDLDISVGEPFTTAEIRQLHKAVKKQDATVSVADLAMLQLVSLNSDRIADSAKDFYGNLGELVEYVQSHDLDV